MLRFLRGSNGGLSVAAFSVPPFAFSVPLCALLFPPSTFVFL